MTTHFWIWVLHGQHRNFLLLSNADWLSAGCKERYHLTCVMDIPERATDELDYMWFCTYCKWWIWMLRILKLMNIVFLISWCCFSFTVIFVQKLVSSCPFSFLGHMTPEHTVFTHYSYSRANCPKMHYSGVNCPRKGDGHFTMDGDSLLRINLS